MSDLPEKVSEPVPETPAAREAPPETEGLSKELTSIGVSVRPTTIPVPEPVEKMGVQPVGANIPMPTAKLDLPISDDQIAEGLGKSIRDSFKWLAEWCVRRLKQVHLGLQSIHGKLTRVTIHA